MKNLICYRKLKQYKYILEQPYSVNINWLGFTIQTEFISLEPNGKLNISKYYCWDGPSGPTIDTKDFMRGSLIHDALYQLIRLELIPEHYRLYADNILRDICLEDGMPKWRAFYVYYAVRWFAKGCAKPGSQKPKEYIYAP